MNEINTVCMDCGQECERWEIVNTAQIGQIWEVWCYCPVCDIETFHPFEGGDDD